MRDIDACNCHVCWECASISCNPGQALDEAPGTVTWHGYKQFYSDLCNHFWMQAYGADVMLAEMFTPCSALLAHNLDLPWINHWPIAPVEVLLLLDCGVLVPMVL